MDDETQTIGTDAPATADTVVTQDSSADVQTNNGAPEAAETQKEVPVNAADTADEKLYAGKYKSPEDMEKAYKELESKFGQTTSEKAELSRILNEAFVPPAPAQAPADTADLFSDEPNPLNQEIDDLKRVTAVQSFVMNHQDADPASMQEVLSSDPYIKQISSHEAKLEYAYLRSQNMSQQKAIAEARKQTASETQAKIVEKQVAQVETAQASAQADTSNNLLERATGNYSPEDRAAARMELIRKNLVKL